MSLKRGRENRSTKSAFKSMQNVHTLAALALVRGSSTLQHVPEHQEIKLEASPKPRQTAIYHSEDWSSLEKAVKNLFQNEDLLSVPGELFKLHQNVRNILHSKTGTFLADYYKQELLVKGMSYFTERLRNVRGFRLLQRMEEIWLLFYTNILPTLEAILYLVKPKGRLSIRTSTLATFRDIVVLGVDFKGIVSDVKRSKKKVPESIEHMVLILQNVHDVYPPNKNQLLIESICASIVGPYLGYHGLYNGEMTPFVASDELKLARRRSSVDVNGVRRVSRPFSVQPVQVETLNQMFLSAIRKKQAGQSAEH